MAYKHGVYGSEIATSLVPVTEVSAGLPVVFGTAPLHLASESAGANKPILCYSYAEAVQQLGYSDDWKNYTLCEFMKSHFALFAVAPVVFVNVLDPAKHIKKAAEFKEIAVTDGVAVISDPALINTLVVKADEAGDALIADEDYTAAYDDDGRLVITPLTEGAVKLLVKYDALDPAAVDAGDIVGGVDTQSGDYEGLELVNQVFPRFRLIPGLILAPGWSHHTEVAAVMAAKASNINGHFHCIALIDIPTEEAKQYSKAPEWKNMHNFMNARQVVCWPLVKLGEAVYHLSTQLAGVICATDAANSDIPFASPSNHSLQCDSSVTADGKEILLATDTAAYLNGQGIVSALNFIGGWKAWGNRMAVYPGNTDPKDAFIPIRRMFDWINNTLITTFWQKVDAPVNKRLVETIVDSANIWLNGLASRQFILGGRVEFRADENTTTDLMDGIIRFHVYITPPSPAREIEFIQEYDPDYLQTLFA